MGLGEGAVWGGGDRQKGSAGVTNNSISTGTTTQLLEIFAEQGNTERNTGSLSPWWSRSHPLGFLPIGEKNFFKHVARKAEEKGKQKPNSTWGREQEGGLFC